MDTLIDNCLVEQTEQNKLLLKTHMLELLKNEKETILQYVRYIIKKRIESNDTFFLKVTIYGLTMKNGKNVSITVTPSVNHLKKVDIVMRDYDDNILNQWSDMTKSYIKRTFIFISYYVQIPLETTDGLFISFNSTKINAPGIQFSIEL